MVGHTVASGHLFVLPFIPDGLLPLRSPKGTIAHYWATGMDASHICFRISTDHDHALPLLGSRWFWDDHGSSGPLFHPHCPPLFPGFPKGFSVCISLPLDKQDIPRVCHSLPDLQCLYVDFTLLYLNGRCGLRADFAIPYRTTKIPLTYTLHFPTFSMNKMISYFIGKER